jgi:uncharacterized protein
MTGERDLAQLVRGMTPVLDPVPYVYCLAADDTLVAGAVALMREAEGVTVILPAALANPGLRPVFPCRRITLTVHSSLEAVGFMAAISAALTRAGIGCNPVAGYYHDHLFVPEDKAEAAMAVLLALSEG